MQNQQERPGLSRPDGVDDSYWARELYQMFAPVRDSLQDRAEDEINRAIDETVAEVRTTAARPFSRPGER